jgi:hypothetical protein
VIAAAVSGAWVVQSASGATRFSASAVACLGSVSRAAAIFIKGALPNAQTCERDKNCDSNVAVKTKQNTLKTAITRACTTSALPVFGQKGCGSQAAGSITKLADCIVKAETLAVISIADAELGGDVPAPTPRPTPVVVRCQSQLFGPCMSEAFFGCCANLNLKCAFGQVGGDPRQAVCVPSSSNEPGAGGGPGYGSASRAFLTSAPSLLE